VALFRKQQSEEPLAVTIAAVKLGNRLLAIGLQDTRLIALLAAKAGLTGRACGVDADADRATRAAVAIEREGVLAEVTTAPWDRLPYEDGSFDVAVIGGVLMTLGDVARLAAASEILRVLRPGGRALVIEPAPRGGFGGLFHREPIDPSYASSGGAVTSLSAARFAAVRELAERGGTRYVEGIKKG
jgi:ubiquinone/menaquinone biosynthesis C-methylase UbiE